MTTTWGFGSRMAWAALATGLAATLALGGCSSEPEAEPATADPVAGEWIDGGGMRPAFDAGTWTVSGADDGDPTFDGGTYALDGTTLTMTTVYGGAFDVDGNTCADGAVGVYEVTVVDDESSIEVTLVSDECEARRGQAGTWQRAD